MAGQVKHTKLFNVRPDWTLGRVLMRLATKNTDSLISGVADVLGDEGIDLIDSTALLAPLLAKAGVLTRRAPTDDERATSISAAASPTRSPGWTSARRLRSSPARSSRSRRWKGPTPSSRGRDSSPAAAPAIIKVAKPNQDMRFDVPVAGVSTVEAMAAAGATALSVDAGKTLMIDGDAIIRAADEAGICDCRPRSTRG